MRLPWQKPKQFFSEEEKARIVQCVRAAEQRTSGEVRVYVESRCKFLDALDRAREVFFQLQMDETEQRNGTLVYVAVDDHQAAVFGDEGIHRKVGTQWWQSEVVEMLKCFKDNHLAEGICIAVTDIGEALFEHFPFNRDTDKNELPDEIVFGK